VPLIDVDGVTVWEPSTALTFSTYDEALTVAREEANHRWPELQSRSNDSHRVPGDGGPLQIAYIQPTERHRTLLGQCQL